MQCNSRQWIVHALRFWLFEHSYDYAFETETHTEMIWNWSGSLLENVVSANTVNTFKNRLDKFWSDQELMYDYKADFTGIGNRSLISLDDTSTL